MRTLKFQEYEILAKGALAEKTLVLNPNEKAIVLERLIETIMICGIEEMNIINIIETIIEEAENLL